MKTFGEYINDNLSDNLLKMLDESDFDYDYDIDDKSIDEGLGSVLGKLSGNFNNFLRKINGLGPKISNIVKVTAQSITSIDDETERQKAKDLIASYDNCRDTDDIIKVNVKYLKDNQNPNSKFNTGLLAYTIQMIKKSKLEESKQYEPELREMFDKQNKALKQDLAGDIKKINNPNDKTPSNGSPKITTPEQLDKKTDNITSKDPIEPLTKLANINANQLKKIVRGMVIDDNGQVWDLKNAGNVITGLCAIISGVQLIKNEELANKIISATGIRNYKEFQAKLKTALENAEEAEK